jgi:hypothetical protein
MQWFWLVRCCFIVALCAVDCAAFYWWQGYVLQAVCAYYFVQLIHKGRGVEEVLCLLAIGLESFLVHGRFGVYLLPVLPLTLAYRLLARFITMTRLVPYALLGITLVVNYWLIDPCLFGVWPGALYTTMKIIGNVLVLFILNW